MAESSAPSSDSDDEDSPLVGHCRSNIHVGKRRNLRIAGSCIGDDVKWIGNKVTRVVSLQAGGVGRDKLQWARYWAECAAELGADIFVLSETRVGTDAGHAQAVAGMREWGYSAISHNVTCDPTPLGQLAHSTHLPPAFS